MHNKKPVQGNLFSGFRTGLYGPSSRDILDSYKISIQYITEKTSAQKVINQLIKHDKPLGLDVETARLPEYRNHSKAALEPHLSKIRLIQIYAGDDQVYLFDMSRLEIDVLDRIWTRPFIAHNAVFDAKHLIHSGAKPMQFGCTMLMDNALTNQLRSLKALAKKYLNLDLPKEMAISDWGADLSSEQLAYAALDAVIVYKLYQLMREELKNHQLGRCYAIMRDAQLSIAKMELVGIHFDEQSHAKLISGWESRHTQSREAIRRLLGDINPDSGKQLSDWLKKHLDQETITEWPLTQTGRLRTDQGAFLRHSGHQLVKPLLAYKESGKLISTYGKSFADHINPVTGRIHANFRLGGTISGRLSCSDPNIQNPPRDKEFRSLFSAPPGRVLIVADYSQIELRVAALISNDKNMLEAYQKGLDLHRITASTISGTPFDNITKAQRNSAKAVNFGLLYGQGPKGLAQYAKATYGVDMTVEEAKKARESFFKKYSDLKSWQQKTAHQAETTGKVTTPSGRVRDFSSEKYGYRYSEALNTPIQGGAAEVMLAAMAILETAISGLDASLVNVVHDEVVVETDFSLAGTVKSSVEKAMIEGMLRIFPYASTLNLVEAHSVKNWSEAK